MADAVKNCAVGEFGKTDATDIFFKFNRQDRPVVVPPHAINGGSADKGGSFNSVGDGSRGTSPSGTSPSGTSDSDEGEEEGGGEEHYGEGEEHDEGGAKGAKGAKESAENKPLNPGTSPSTLAPTSTALQRRCLHGSTPNSTPHSTLHFPTPTPHPYSPPCVGKK